MIANSPVRQNSPLNMHGIDVVPYQPPWKALSEFALYTNLDNDVINQQNPAFRRLINQVGSEMVRQRTASCKKLEKKLIALKQHCKSVFPFKICIFGNFVKLIF